MFHVCHCNCHITTLLQQGGSQAAQSSSKAPGKAAQQHLPLPPPVPTPLPPPSPEANSAAPPNYPSLSEAVVRSPPLAVVATAAAVEVIRRPAASPVTLEAAETAAGPWEAVVEEEEEEDDEADEAEESEAEEDEEEEGEEEEAAEEQDEEESEPVVLNLPYGGNVNLAMRANDRAAIRAIFEFRKKLESGSSSLV